MAERAKGSMAGRTASQEARRSFTTGLLVGAGLCLVASLILQNTEALTIHNAKSFTSIVSERIMAWFRSISTLLLATSVPVSRALCPPAGPLLPPPHLPGPTDDCVLDESDLWEVSFDPDTSYAIKAAIGDVDIISLEHTSPLWKVDGRRSLFDTQFRVASVTKLFTVLAVLLSPEKIEWEASIRSYVKDLDDVYDDITIRALAGHTSGLGFFGYVNDKANERSFHRSRFGLPSISNGTVGTCDAIWGARRCSKEEIAAMFNAPAQRPQGINAGPRYSNIAFNLLGMALEEVHGKEYEDIIQDLILNPLNLTSATFRTPSSNVTAILPRTNSDHIDPWAAIDFGNFNPTGGLWMTPNDLSKFTRSILDNALLSATQTRAWLRVESLLPSLYQLTGEPWEVLRRPTDGGLFMRNLYTKSGSIPGYAAFAVVVPEFNMTVSINVAGRKALTIAEDLLHFTIDEALYYAGNEAQYQAHDNYAGRYTEPSSNSSISICSRYYTLAICEFVMNGANVLDAFNSSRDQLTVGDADYTVAPGEPIRLRLYPTDPDSLGAPKQHWRYYEDERFDARRKFNEHPDPRPFLTDLRCQGWTQLDKKRYGGESMDRLNFLMSGRNATGIELPAWRMNLTRVAVDDPRYPPWEGSILASRKS